MKLNDIDEGIEGAAFIVSAFLTPFLRPRRARWGATDDEIRRTLPGDQLVPHPKWGWTYAVTIKAPVAEVWPWIVQMGTRRLQGHGKRYRLRSLLNGVHRFRHGQEYAAGNKEACRGGEESIDFADIQEERWVSC